jgi:hypothetical protein
MKIYKCSSKVDDIKNTISKIINDYNNIAFISYIDGEYGMRTYLYTTIVKNFIEIQKELNNIIVGICFKGLTFLLESCDIIIEIQDSTFEDLQENEIIHSQSDSIIFVPSFKYNGTNGWCLSLIRGVHFSEYEDMLEKFNFSNIFYTTHLDGSYYINKINSVYTGNNLIFGKIKNENYIYNTDINKYLQLVIPKNIIKNKEKNNNIAIWIRNTNKHPGRNVPKNIYTTLFEYCIKNKKHLYIFMDLNPVNVEDNEYLHICNINMNGNLKPNFDDFLEICKKCYIYVGADSGIADYLSYYTNINIILSVQNNNYSPFAKLNGVNMIANNDIDLINYLHSLYS